jgi:hypothetical protein
MQIGIASGAIALGSEGRMTIKDLEYSCHATHVLVKHPLRVLRENIHEACW